MSKTNMPVGEIAVQLGAGDNKVTVDTSVSDATTKVSLSGGEGRDTAHFTGAVAVTVTNNDGQAVIDAGAKVVAGGTAAVPVAAVDVTGGGAAAYVGRVRLHEASNSTVRTDRCRMGASAGLFSGEADGRQGASEASGSRNGRKAA